MVDAVQHLNPYRETALEYKKAGWHGALPIPHKQKNPPPTGFTGHRAPYPDVNKINEWRKSNKRQNICVRLAGVDEEHEIVGIDVDHYQSGDKRKRGGDQLKDLENRFGVLPATWISSSRTDGISGIRYYRVPRGMAFRGQVAKDIECISKGYRFAVVYPSIHPSGETYWWFPLGVVPNGDGRLVWDAVLPDARSLPVLPEPWLEYLTQNKMRANNDDRIDMDSTPQEIYQWCDDTFYGEDDTPMCRLYTDKLKKHRKSIVDESTLHDKITNGHWNLIRLAAEGHVGWNTAINEFEQICLDKAIDAVKRGRDEIISEIWRSRVNALRKVKAQCDEQVKIGAAPILSRCDEPGGVCYTGVNTEFGDSNDGDNPPPDDPLDDIPRGPIKPVDEFLMNDDGNAAHLVNMFSSLKDGTAFKFVEGYGWIVWHKGKGEDQPRWELDSEGDQEMRQMFQRIRDDQTNYAEDALKVAWLDLQAKFDNQTPGVSKADVEIAKTKYKEWKAFALANGNNRNAENAIKASKSVPGVSISVNKLNQNPRLLGVSNGVVQLGIDDVQLRPAEPRDLITLNTHVPYLDKPSALASSTWEKYLDTFIPDLEHRRNIQIILGYTLIGGNSEKRIIILKGKSDTGKSTMLSAIQSALGDYAAPINESMFQAGHFNEVLSNALDKRVVVCSEFDATTKLSGSVVKRLTGGDTQTFPIKHSNAVKEGEVQFVTIIATNNTPDITPADKALQNRLLVIPFEVMPQNIDRSLTTVVIQTCSTAVLWWLIEGYKQYSIQGQLPTSKLIEDTTIEFMSDLDHVAMFLNEAVVKHDRFGRNIDWRLEAEWCEKRDNVFKHYKNWCDINQISEREQLSPHLLTRRLKAMGVVDSGNVNVSVNGVIGKYWYGVKIKKLRRGGNVFPIRTQSEDEEPKV